MMYQKKGVFGFFLSLVLSLSFVVACSDDDDDEQKINLEGSYVISPYCDREYSLTGNGDKHVFNAISTLRYYSAEMVISNNQIQITTLSCIEDAGECSVDNITQEKSVKTFDYKIVGQYKGGTIIETTNISYYTTLLTDGIVSYANEHNWYDKQDWQVGVEVDILQKENTIISYRTVKLSGEKLVLLGYDPASNDNPDPSQDAGRFDTFTRQ